MFGKEILKCYEEFAGPNKQLHKLDKDLWLIHAARITTTEAEIHFITNEDNVILHWGILKPYSDKTWLKPHKPYPIMSKETSSNALDTRFVEDVFMFDEKVYNVHIKMFDIEEIKGIIFVINQYDKWYNNNKNNYHINFI